MSRLTGDKLDFGSVEISTQDGDTFATFIKRIRDSIDYSKIKADSQLVVGSYVFTVSEFTSTTLIFSRSSLIAVGTYKPIIASYVMIPGLSSYKLVEWLDGTTTQYDSQTISSRTAKVIY